MADIVTLDEVYSLPDIQTTNNWYLDFAKMPKTGIDISRSDINIRCQSFTVPSIQVKDLAVTIHNHVRHQSTTTTQPAQVQVPMLETKDMKTTKFLVAWREICSRTNDNYVSVQADREATINFYTYSPQHDIVYTFVMEHCELRNLGDITYNEGGSPAALIRTATIQVGRVIEMD